jgi:hypothetical protein
MPIATRLTNAGTLLVNGIFDENTSFSLIADALVIGGGGAGGHLGGGGAGGHRYFVDQSLVANTNYTVTVGAGGTASAGATGNAGSNSVFDIYTSAGGGGGAGEAALPTAGGSGGGGGGVAGTSRPGAAGNTPSTSPSQGNAGGNGNDNGAGTAFAGGGGGGAGGTGNNAPGTTTAGDGGLGTPNSITGSSVTRAGGGGGGAYSLGSTGTAGTGGSSIGGNGGRNALNATSGSPNTGSGGGGNGYTSAGNLQGSSGGGGSGVVILKYPNTFSISNSGGGLTFTTDSSGVAGYKITTFTAGTGQISFTALTKFRTTSNTVYAGTLDEFTGAPVVDSSLKLWLDSAQTTSYPGSGTTWTDLSGNGNNGTLNNGVGFNGSNGGGLVFDGSDDYIDLNTNNIITGTNPFTFSCFYTITAVNGGGEIFGNYGTGYTTNYLWISGEYGAYLDGAVYFPGAPISAGTYHMAVTRDSSGSVILYKNGVQVNSGTLANSIAVGPNFRIGADTSTTPGVGGERLNGKIYSQMVYNRALTAAEIVQNYNALQSRYELASITATQMPVVQRQQSSGTLLVNGEFDEFTGAPIVDSSLKLWLDAAQTTSYSGSGSTWTDLSGNGNNGTLVNAPSFISNDAGGCIQLDGSNDHITLPVTGFAPASLTIDYWIKRISDNGYFWLIDNSDQPELRMLFQSSGKLQIFFYDDGAYFSTSLSSTTFSTASWYNITATMTNGLQNVYINGNQEILTTTGTYTGGPSGNAGEHTLGTYNRPGAGYGGYANVRIGGYRFYNRVLTADEITTNFNALRNRYGI